MKKIILIIVCLTLLLCSLQAKREKVATMKELLVPNNMFMDSENAYFLEKEQIYIYSRKDWKFVAKFGREGEGPKEFKKQSGAMGQITIYPLKDKLQISSMGKISYWKKNGEFIKEFKIKDVMSMNYGELPNGNYVAQCFVEEKKGNAFNAFKTRTLYNNKLDKLKVLGKINVGSGSRGSRPKVKILEQTLSSAFDDKNIYVVSGTDFVVNVFDHKGREKFSIKRDYKRALFPDRLKKAVMKKKLEKVLPEYKEMAKKMFVFPDKFPAIMGVKTDSQKVYFLAFSDEFMSGKVKVFVYDQKGKFLRNSLIRMEKEEGSLEPYPGVIKDGYYYQIIVNDDEEWELFREKI